MISLEVFHSLRKIQSNYVVLSSNIRNDLNFLHLECFTLGIPIIHNCKPYAKNNLFYEDSDSTIELNKACSYLEQIYENPYKTPPSLPYPYHPTYKKNVDGYKSLIKPNTKPKIHDLLNLLKIDPEKEVKEVKEVGIVTYFDKNCNLDIFQKGLDNINMNIKTPISMIIYVSNSFVKALASLHFNLINYKFELLDKVKGIDSKGIDSKGIDSKGIELYCIGHSPFEKTLYYRPNTIVSFNFIELVEKFQDEFIIASHMDKSIRYNELVKALSKYIFIANTSLGTSLDTNMILFKSKKCKELCRLIINFNGFNEMFGENLLDVIILLSNSNIVNLPTTITQTENGYMTVLNNVILSMVHI